MLTSLYSHLSGIKGFLWHCYSSTGWHKSIIKFLGWKAQAWIIVAVVAICVMLARAAFVLFLRSKQANCNEHDTLRMLPAMRALSVVFTPASGGRYSHLASYFHFSNFETSLSGSRVQLDLRELLDNLSSGAIELRDTRFLADLFRGQLKIYDCDLKLCIHRSWWLLASKWMASQQLHVPLNLQSAAQLTYHDLDYVYYHNIDDEISRLQRIHHPGSTLTIEFSCRAPGIGFLSLSYVLCLVPFLYTPTNQNHSPDDMYRTSTPLLLTLPKVVTTLLNERLAILTVTDISSERAQALLAQEKGLVTNKSLRSRMIRNRGLTGWQKSRFALVWQAGLLSAGLLIRWRIVLRVKTKHSD